MPSILARAEQEVDVARRDLVVPGPCSVFALHAAVRGARIDGRFTRHHLYGETHAVARARFGG